MAKTYWIITETEGPLLRDEGARWIARPVAEEDLEVAKTIFDNYTAIAVEVAAFDEQTEGK